MLKYKCESMREEIILSEGKIRGRIRKAGFYDSEWEVEETKQLIGSKISAFGKTAKIYNLTVDLLGTKKERANNANRFFELAESDILNETAGKLYINDWYVNCYIIGRESGGRDSRNHMVQVEAKIYVPYPFWIFDTQYTFRSFGTSSSDNKRYPGRYPYRYANGLNNSYIINSHFTDANFKLIIYGPVINPMVIVGGVPYLVNIVMEEGERLEIDSRSGTVVKFMRNGTQVNAFHNRAKKRTFFKKIPPGRHNISWTGKFDFDLIIYKERSEPIWSG